MESPGQAGKRRRAQLACQFCRQRKMRCSNELPKCATCVSYDEDCVYNQGPKKARPSNSRISCLEEENRQLQARLAGHPLGDGASLRDGLPSVSGSLQNDSGDAESSSTARDQRGERESSVQHGQTPLAPKTDVEMIDEAAFHGPSSLLFDEAPLNLERTLSSESEKCSAETASTALMEEAAKQRKLHMYIHSLSM